VRLEEKVSAPVGGLSEVVAELLKVTKGELLLLLVAVVEMLMKITEPLVCHTME